jgi:nitroreductase
MSEFLKAMAFRHACKVFDTEKQIPQEQFDSMLEVARTSPSSFGMEPWRMIVVRNPNLRKALKSACWNQSQITDCSELVIFTTDNDIVRSDTAYVRRMFERRGLSAEAVDTYIGVYKQYLDPIEADEVLLENWTAKQCYIALANMMTYAATLEIDTCPIEGFDKEEVEAILDLEYGHSIAVICAFGYRVKGQSEQKRLELGQIVEYRQ